MEITQTQRYQPKDENLNIRVWSWLLDGIARKARKEGITSSDWIREQLIKGLENE